MRPPEIHRPRVQELGIDTEALALAMGYPDGVAPDYLHPVLARVIAEAPDHLDLVCGWRIFEPEEFQRGTESVSIRQLHFDTGRIIANGLRKADGVAVFVATTGPGIAPWCQAAYHEEEHPILAYAIDAFGSEAADRAADWMDQRLAEDLKAEGWGITDRYSPGYCNWSVAEQHKLFSLLPEGFCGVTLSESALMTPIKSVSGVIGIGAAARKHGYVCQMCTMENCFRRNLRKV